MKENVVVAICTSVSVIKFLDSFVFMCFKMFVIMLKINSSLKKISSVKLLDLIYFCIILLLKKLKTESFALLIHVCFDSSE